MRNVAPKFGAVDPVRPTRATPPHIADLWQALSQVRQGQWVGDKVAYDTKSDARNVFNRYRDGLASYRGCDAADFRTTVWEEDGLWYGAIRRLALGEAPYALTKKGRAMRAEEIAKIGSTD